MRSSIFGQANDPLFKKAKKQLAEAAKYVAAGDNDRAFYLFTCSVENSCGRLEPVLRKYAAQTHFTPEQLRRVGEQSDAITELLQAIEPDDEKLDVLFDFLEDSERETDGYQRFLYRQMVLSFIAGIDNRPIAAVGKVSADRMEKALDFRFALGAYLETFIAYQQWCLDFAERYVALPEEMRHAVRSARLHKGVVVGVSA